MGHRIDVDVDKAGATTEVRARRKPERRSSGHPPHAARNLVPEESAIARHRVQMKQMINRVRIDVHRPRAGIDRLTSAHKQRRPTRHDPNRPITRPPQQRPITRNGIESVERGYKNDPDCRLIWLSQHVTAIFYHGYGGLQGGSCVSGSGTFSVTFGSGWRTDTGLAVGASRATLKQIYPRATQHGSNWVLIASNAGWASSTCSKPRSSTTKSRR